MICLKFFLKAFKFLFQLVLPFFLCLDIQAQFLPQSHYKSEVVNNIGKKIAAARGDMRLMPVIEINSNSNKQPLIAQFKSSPQPKIILDEKVYDICKNFGADSLNALACVIGHEMGHFYENHVWSGSFSDMIGLAKERSLAISNEDKGMLEAKADAFGLFYGFLAGYDTYRVMPKTLEAIYKGYKIPDQQEGYPDKSERLRFSEEKIREISPLRFIFWAGQLLLLRKEFEAAVSCFDYILSQYPSPEIYNNTGLARLARAMELMDTQEIYFAYPFELDANTRLKRGTLRTNVKPKESELTVNLLSDAQAAFEKALDMDNGYSPAYINLACTYSLQGNQAAAVGKINELEVLNGSTRLPGNAHLIRGIALVKDGQVGKANTDFDKVKQKKAFQHTYNLELYKQISASWEDKTIHWLTHWPTAENWIKSFWNQSKESKSTPPDGKWETIPFSKIELTEKPEVSVVIPGPQFPVKVSGKTNAEGYSLQLDLPDYRLDVIYSRSILSMSDVQETKIGTSISSSQIRSTNPSYSISGTGGIRYDYYQNEGVVFEMENEIRRGWWKYLISY